MSLQFPYVLPPVVNKATPTYSFGVFPLTGKSTCSETWELGEISGSPCVLLNMMKIDVLKSDDDDDIATCNKNKLTKFVFANQQKNTNMLIVSGATRTRSRSWSHYIIAEARDRQLPNIIHSGAPGM